jgi:hypothetical protein
MFLRMMMHIGFEDRASCEPVINGTVTASSQMAIS